MLRSFIRKSPDRAACFEIQILMNMTARAFGTRSKRVWDLAPGKALRTYASFTVGCMEKRKADPRRLYAEAYKTGRKVRLITGLTDPEDIEMLVFYLYRNIGIKMKGSIPGEIIVSGCCFSRSYSPEQCALMSWADSGIIAGLSGGGKLDFSERLTEGCSRCRAVFKMRRTNG